MAKLKRYLSHNVLKGDQFVCRFSESRKSSQVGQFYEVSSIISEPTMISLKTAVPYGSSLLGRNMVTIQYT